MADQRPNIIFIITDQQRWDALGINNPAIQTPFLDSLAASGTYCPKTFRPAAQCTAISRLGAKMALGAASITPFIRRRASARVVRGKPRGTCGLMTRNPALSTMKLHLMPVPEVGGVLYLRAATSKLPWKAKMVALIPKIDVHLGIVG